MSAKRAPSPLGRYFEAIRSMLLEQSHLVLGSHRALRGRARELVAHELLERHLPPSMMAITNVQIMDSRWAAEGNASGLSSEQDIVVQRRDVPRFAGGPVTVSPIESVVACIEVKSTLNASSLGSVRHNCMSVSKLRCVQGHTAKWAEGGLAATEAPVRPLLGVVCYKAWKDRAALVSKANEVWREEGPDFVLHLERGLVVRRRNGRLVLRTVGDEWVRGGGDSDGAYARVFDYRQPWRGLAAVVFELTERVQRTMALYHDFAPYVSGAGPKSNARR